MCADSWILLWEAGVTNQLHEWNSPAPCNTQPMKPRLVGRTLLGSHKAGTVQSRTSAARRGFLQQLLDTA